MKRKDLNVPRLWIPKCKISWPHGKPWTNHSLCHIHCLQPLLHRLDPPNLFQKRIRFKSPHNRLPKLQHSSNHAPLLPNNRLFWMIRLSHVPSVFARTSSRIVLTVHCVYPVGIHTTIIIPLHLLGLHPFLPDPRQ